jgi:hypothetical protein
MRLQRRKWRKNFFFGYETPQLTKSENAGAKRTEKKYHEIQIFQEKKFSPRRDSISEKNLKPSDNNVFV